MPTPLRFLAMVGLAVLILLVPRWLEEEPVPAEQPCSVGRAPDLVDVRPTDLRPPETGGGPGLRAVLADRYEPRPDRRFLHALALADCMVTGEAPAEITGSFEGGAWALAYRGHPVGALPSMPDFGDALGLLSGHLERVGTVGLAAGGASLVDGGGGAGNGSTGRPVRPATLAALNEAVDDMGPAGVVDALVRANTLWNEGQRDPAVLAVAARGLVALAVLDDDPLELADPLAARALAALAVARHAGDADLREEEALLAHHMGYTRHAHDVVGALPADDATRLYVLGEADALRARAEEPGATARTRRLASGLPEAGTADEVTTDDLTLPPFMPPGFRTAMYVARVLVDQHGVDPASDAVGFDDQMTARTARLQGPFLDADTYASHLAGAFYGDVFRDAAARSRRAGPADPEYVVRRLGPAETGVARDLADWYARLGRAEPGDLEVALATHGALGPRAHRQTLQELGEMVRWHDPPRALDAAQTFTRRLDSRAEHLSMLGSLAGGHLFDPLTRDRAYRRAAELAGPGRPMLQAWMAMYDGDGEALDRMIRDPARSLAARTYAFELAARQRRLPDARIHAAARALLAAAPSEWAPHAAYLEYLEDIARADAAIELVRGWLDRHPDARRSAVVSARTDIARLLQSAGREDEAWAWIEPAVESGQLGAVARAAAIRADRGEAEEALALARSAVERYPRSGAAHAALAEVFWRLGDPTSAARTVREARPVLGAHGWGRDIAPALGSAFEHRPAREAAGPLAALHGAGLESHELISIADGLRRSGRPDLAFALASGFPPDGLEGLDWMVAAHDYLAESEGEERAVAWYRRALPPEMAGPASMFMFAEGHEELLWAAIPDPVAPPDASWIWLMRAAGFVQAGGTEDQRGRLTARFRREDGDAYHRMGRYLMGFDDETTVLFTATSPDRLAEVAYYIGVKAEAEGRIRDAIEWYHVVLDTGLWNEGEYRWARRQLREWATGARSVVGAAVDGP